MACVGNFDTETFLPCSESGVNNPSKTPRQVIDAAGSVWNVPLNPDGTLNEAGAQPVMSPDGGQLNVGQKNLSFDERMRLAAVNNPTFHTSQSLQDPAALAQERAIADAQLAEKRASDLRQIQAEMQRLGMSQTFQAGESAAERAFRQAQQGESLAAQANESGAGRNFTAQQSAIDRASQNSQFAATFGLEAQAARRQQLNDLFGRQQQLEQLRMENAKNLANVISLVDPAALPAFYQAGGGNISNAVSRGANAVSDNAVLPAAQNFDVANQTAQTLGNITGEYNTLRGSPLPTYTPPPEPVYNPYMPSQYQAPQTSSSMTPRFANGQSFGGGGPSYLGMTGMDALSAYNAQPQGAGDATAALAAYGTPQAAQGGMFGGQVVVGDSRNGRPNPELVMGQGPFSVIPLSQLPHMADGGVVDPTGGAQIITGQQQAQATPESILKVRQIRNAVDVGQPLGVGPYNPQFGLLPPSLIARYYAAIQSRYGVPVNDQFSEQQRYQLSGARRNPSFNSYLQQAV